MGRVKEEEGEEGRKGTIPLSLPPKFRLPHLYFKTLSSHLILFVYINVQWRSTNNALETKDQNKIQSLLTRPPENTQATKLLKNSQLCWKTQGLL